MITVVALYGTGDCYLTCSLVREMQVKYKSKINLVVKEAHECIPSLFGLEKQTVVNNSLVESGENRVFAKTYPNEVNLTAPGMAEPCFFMHPSFVRTPVRLDHLISLPSIVSMLDMHRCLAGLPPKVVDAERGQFKTSTSRYLNKCLIIPQAKSWPISFQNTFWLQVAAELETMNWRIDFADDKWSLHDLLTECYSSEWVIGPQCGVMSMLCHMQFPCRKTFITPSVDGHRFDEFFPTQTFPFAYVTKFAGEDYDVDQFKLPCFEQAFVNNLIDDLRTSPNATKAWPHFPNPLSPISIPVSLGDLIDRLAILDVKLHKFSGTNKFPAVQREYWRLYEASSLHIVSMLDADRFHNLRENHLETFDLFETLVPNALNGQMTEVEHMKAIALNKIRNQLKSEVDRRRGYVNSDVKSYY